MDIAATGCSSNIPRALELDSSGCHDLSNSNDITAVGGLRQL